MSIRIAKGLKSSYKNARAYTLEQAFLQLDKYTDNYEVLNSDYNRVYGDIDGKDLNLTESEFDALNLETRKAIEEFLAEAPYCLLTASSYSHRKISWRFVITNIKTTLKDNKQWVINNNQKIKLPPGISFDSAPYGKNQKIRMLGSNKDGENRPLKLVKGDKLDTLISYIPEDCQLVNLEEPQAPQEQKNNSDTKGQANPILLHRIVLNITNDESTTWEQWYKVSQAIFNEGGTLDLFLEWSAKSPKHREREAIKHWGSLKPGTEERLSAGSLFYWSKLSNPEEYEKIIFECTDPENYHHKKILFEREHFKLKEPVCFARESKDGVLLYKESELQTLYKNQYFYDGGKRVNFVKFWLLDPYIRTYEKIVFQPMREVEKQYYNLFRGFPMEKVEGDISVMKDLMWNLSGKNQEVFDYIENYFAHLIQKPYQKAKKCLLFQSNQQGAGKDTPLDAIGKILGSEYFFNTGDPENHLFGRFTGHLQKVLLLKLEEVSFETNKKFESKLLNLITADAQAYEDKGSKTLNLADYKRIVMTTNSSVPVSIPESDRRFVLIKVSEDRVGDFAYWKRVHAELEKPETLQAYHYYLATKDISNFDLEKRPITDFYKDVKLSLRPYHAVFFQNWLEHNGEITEQHTQTATEWIEDINAVCKYTITTQKFGKDRKVYPENVLYSKPTKFGCSYTIYSTKMMAFLKQKGWWAEG